LKQQIDNSIHELKSLQDNLNFATLAAVGNRALESIPIAGAPVYAKTPEQEQPGAIVGLEQHINHIIDFTKRGGVSLIGIYGQAGLGKTTLLNKVVAQIEKAEKQTFAYLEVSDDLQRLQSSLLLQLGGEKKEFSSTSQGRNAILYQLQKLKQQHKVVRIAVDNLFDPRLVGELFPHSMGKVLSTNSCVIITCPSLAILNKMDQLCRTAVPAYHYLPFKLPHLGSEHAKALFLSHAASHPVNLLSSANGVISRYENLANHFLPLCEGLPLALKLVGLYFSKPVNRNEENWMAVSKHMKLVADAAETPEDQMFTKLMVSRAACAQEGHTHCMFTIGMSITAVFKFLIWKNCIDSWRTSSCSTCNVKPQRLKGFVWFRICVLEDYVSCKRLVLLITVQRLGIHLAGIFWSWTTQQVCPLLNGCR